MPTQSDGISRRRILQAGLWAAPAIVIATSAPAAAASQAVNGASLLRITNVTIRNLSAGSWAMYNFDFEYSVYNDFPAFSGTGLEPWQAAQDPAFSTWAVTWILEILDSNNSVVQSFTDNVILQHGGSYKHPDTNISVPTADSYTARLTLTSAQIATANGVSFTAQTVTQSTAPEAVN